MFEFVSNAVREYTCGMWAELLILGVISAQSAVWANHTTRRAASHLTGHAPPTTAPPRRATVTNPHIVRSLGSKETHIQSHNHCRWRWGGPGGTAWTVSDSLQHILAFWHKRTCHRPTMLWLFVIFVIAVTTLGPIIALSHPADTVSRIREHAIARTCWMPRSISK